MDRCYVQEVLVCHSAHDVNLSVRSLTSVIRSNELKTYTRIFFWNQAHYKVKSLLTRQLWMF